MCLSSAKKNPSLSLIKHFWPIELYSMASLVVLPNLLSDVTIYEVILILEELLCITLVVLYGAIKMISRSEILELDLSYHTLIGMLDYYTSNLCF